MARITIEIPDELAASLRARATAEGLSETELVLDALSDRLLGAAPPAPDPERRARIDEGARDLAEGRSVAHERVRPWLEQLATGRRAAPPE